MSKFRIELQPYTEIKVILSDGEAKLYYAGEDDINYFFHVVLETMDMIPFKKAVEIEEVDGEYIFDLSDVAPEDVR